MSLGKEIIDLFAFLTNSTEDYNAATELAKAKAGFETSGHHIAQELEVVDSNHAVVLSGNRNTVAIHQAAEDMGISPMALENLMSIRAMINGDVAKIVAQGEMTVKQIRESGEQEREKLRISGAQQLTTVIAQCNSALEQLKQAGINQIAAIQEQGKVEVNKLITLWINEVEKAKALMELTVEQHARMAQIDLNNYKKKTRFGVKIRLDAFKGKHGLRE